VYVEQCITWGLPGDNNSVFDCFDGACREVNAYAGSCKAEPDFNACLMERALASFLKNDRLKHCEEQATSYIMEAINGNCANMEPWH